MIGCVALATMGCTYSERPEAAAPIAKCSDKKLGSLIGKTMSEKVGAQAKRLSGAIALRVVRPGMMVTMDYREDRLNLHLDAKGKILNARCG